MGGVKVVWVESCVWLGFLRMFSGDCGQMVALMRRRCSICINSSDVYFVKGIFGVETDCGVRGCGGENKLIF